MQFSHTKKKEQRHSDVLYSLLLHKSHNRHATMERGPENPGIPRSNNVPSV